MTGIKTTIKNSGVTIFPEVETEYFGRINAFDVKAICYPPYHGSDKELMLAVCEALTEQTAGKVVLKTHYVVRDVQFVSEFYVEKITFQVITSLKL